MPERVSLGINSDVEIDDSPLIDLSELVGSDVPHEKPDQNLQDSLAKEAVKYGFTSRQPRKIPAKKRTPYTVQNNIKVRPGIKELFQEVSLRLGTYDQATLELAIIALLEKEEFDDLILEFNHLGNI